VSPADSSPARDAASAAALELIEPEMTIGLGSGRAVWRVVDRIAERWPQHPPLRAVVASELTHVRAREAGIEIVELDGTFELDIAIARSFPDRVCASAGGSDEKIICTTAESSAANAGPVPL
jgi:ribose 5-phosphate isomerase